MKFLPLSIVTIILIAALAANIWFWMKVFQREELPPQPMDVCATYKDKWHDICKQTVEFVQERFRGEIVIVELLEDVQQESEFALSSPPEERFWHIIMRLDSPVQFEDKQLEGEIGIFVSKGGKVVGAYQR